MYDLCDAGWITGPPFPSCFSHSPRSSVFRTPCVCMCMCVCMRVVNCKGGASISARVRYYSFVLFFFFAFFSRELAKIAVLVALFSMSTSPACLAFIHCSLKIYPRSRREKFSVPEKCCSTSIYSSACSLLFVFQVILHFTRLSILIFPSTSSFLA